MREDLLKIIETHGTKNQMVIFIEEMSELIKVLCKWYRKYDELDGDISEELLTNMKEEIADVQVVLNQFLELLGIDHKEIYDIAVQKVDRQLERMESEKEC